jgi:hypothetical protein
MTGDALTNECFLDRHEECKDDIVGYQGAHVECTCPCHKKRS